MFHAIITLADSRIIIQSSTSLMSDERQLSVKKLKRFKINYTRPSSLHDNIYNNYYNKADMDVMLSRLSMISELQITSTTLSSPVPSARDVDVVPDVRGLDFFRRSPFRRSRTSGRRTPKLTNWRLAGAKRRDGGDRITEQGLPSVEQSAVFDHPTAGPEWRIAVRRIAVHPAVILIYLAVGFSGFFLTMIAVWIWRRRRSLETASKL